MLSNSKNILRFTSIASINAAMASSNTYLIRQFQFCHKICWSHGPPRCCARGPSPLEVKSAQLPGYIHHLADEIESRRMTAFHGLGRSEEHTSELQSRGHL